jgi:uncharacterized membrane protein
MSSYEQGIEVNVPVREAYNQWTLFEEFPKFMEGVDSVTQVTDTRNHWVAEIAGVRREFDTEITEQVPDQRIAWRTLDGAGHSGVVTFHRLTDNSAKVMLQMEFDPDGFLENVADKLGFVKARVSGDMERFKKYIEERGGAEGGWRGEVKQDKTG